MPTPAWFDRLDHFMVHSMNHYGITVLRIALGIVFVWFGALKVFGVSPVAYLIEETHGFLPNPEFIIFLGLWEIVVGLGLLFKKCLRTTLFFFWLQMLGTVTAPLLAWNLFFTDGNPLLLTVEGEFVVKNMILIAAGIVIGGYEVKRKPARPDDSVPPGRSGGDLETKTSVV